MSKLSRRSALAALPAAALLPVTATATPSAERAVLALAARARDAVASFDRLDAIAREAYQAAAHALGGDTRVSIRIGDRRGDDGQSEPIYAYSPAEIRRHAAQLADRNAAILRSFGKGAGRLLDVPAWEAEKLAELAAARARVESLPVMQRYRAAEAQATAAMAMVDPCEDALAAAPTTASAATAAARLATALRRMEENESLDDNGPTTVALLRGALADLRAGGAA